MKVEQEHVSQLVDVVESSLGTGSLRVGAKRPSPTSTIAIAAVSALDDPPGSGSR